MEIFCFQKNAPEFPKILKDLPDAPKEIYLKGNLKLLNQPSFAIVGTRKCTFEGREIAKKFARELSFAGLNIVSGLAFGIDSAAHEGALEGKNGKTIAVLGSALNNITPHAQEKLAQKILDNNGLIISEYQSGAPIFPSNFLRRNRIIAGLSLGVLIVEAPFGSGAIITAQCAKKYNRPLFAIPGSITSKNYEATNDLIKRGMALLVIKPKDILDYLKEKSLFIQEDKNRPGNITIDDKYLNDSLEEKIIRILKAKPATIDEIAKQLNTQITELLILITEMEISGQVKDIGNKRYIAVE